MIGRGIQLDQEPHTIVGVMPPGFEVFCAGTDLWAPLPWEPASRNHKATFSQGLARLAPGVTPEAATRELVELVAGDAQGPREGRTTGGESFTSSRCRRRSPANVRPALLILLGAVGLILMLAAVNLGTLVLGRSIERVDEMALRTALGASRGRLIKQIVTEQAVLAVAGALAGIGLAYVALPALISRIPPEVPRVGHIALDWTVLATVLAASIAVAVLVSLDSRRDHRASKSAAAAAAIAHDRHAGAAARARLAGRRADRARRRARHRLDADAAIAVEPAARRSRVHPQQRADVPAADHLEVPRADQRPALSRADARARRGDAGRDRRRRSPPTCR